ncbi:hypothetical protein SGGMMB4_04232 [Sodalis glossinidius str. 'morsitans']|uniref:Uncharacterized protein n=1 Tax=Sodalis glossinidius (strain morsitans) TaxID=343509 RepID=A0A193QLP5_SODGM|nr:hypothetical protein SGGMMB4_04232 [Sodalis glossinidius str. 'morsitans']
MPSFVFSLLFTLNCCTTGITFHWRDVSVALASVRSLFLIGWHKMPVFEFLVSRSLGAKPVFSDNEFSVFRRWTILVVHRIAVEHDDAIGVLLDAA